MKKCEKCGHEIKENDKYCPTCGNEIKGEEKIIKKNNKKIGMIIMIFILVLSVGGCIVYMNIRNNDLNRMCLKYLDEYQVEENEECIKVIVTAPDYYKIVESLDNSDDVEKELRKELKKKELPLKTYEIQVKDTKRETIEKAYLNTITGEMLLAGMQDVLENEVWEIKE